MCLILFAVRPNAKYRLVVAANRDEFYGRPAARADYWCDYPDILAGRDLEAGGTWLGVTRGGRFAAVTNFRETPPDPIPPRSRGALPTRFLAGDADGLAYTREVLANGAEYRGFNLIVDDGHACWYVSNRIPAPVPLPPGFYGLSNQLLDCDWPKVGNGREHLRKIVGSNAGSSQQAEELFALLSDRGSGEPFSNAFIDTAEYGTCAATILTIATTGAVRFTEHSFTSHGRPAGTATYEFDIGRG